MGIFFFSFHIHSDISYIGVYTPHHQIFKKKNIFAVLYSSVCIGRRNLCAGLLSEVYNFQIWFLCVCLNGVKSDQPIVILCITQSTSSFRIFCIFWLVLEIQLYIHTHTHTDQNKYNICVCIIQIHQQHPVLKTDINII